MSVEYKFDEESNFLYSRFYGVLTDEDLRNQAQAVVDDPRIQPGVKEIVDLRGVDSVEASTDSLGVVINIDLEHSEKLAGQKTAIVAPRELLFGLSKIYEIMYEQSQAPADIKVFRDIGEARKWLELKPKEK
jgi:hypothetical protein